jgi:hypothetical protein
MAKFDDAPPQRSASSLAIGETRSIAVKDRDGSLTEVLELHRTARPYAFDLADAYNRRATGNQSVEWVVCADGSMHVQNLQSPYRLKTQAENAAEAERRQFNHRQRYPVA